MKKLVAQLRHLAITANDNDKMEYRVYYDSYFEWLKLLRHLGKLIAIATNDLTEKANNIKSNTINLSKECKLFKENDDEY